MQYLVCSFPDRVGGRFQGGEESCVADVHAVVHIQVVDVTRIVLPRSGSEEDVVLALYVML